MFRAVGDHSSLLQETFTTAVVFNGDNRGFFLLFLFYFFGSLSESKSCHALLLLKMRSIRVAIEQTGRIRIRE